uniref:Uncharacterized protein n=1 Tax=Cacopsylla melanoneura TaxID=428564 RepID=A0A8D8WXI2_9HEMI
MVITLNTKNKQMYEDLCAKISTLAKSSNALDKCRLEEEQIFNEIKSIIEQLQTQEDDITLLKEEKADLTSRIAYFTNITYRKATDKLTVNNTDSAATDHAATSEQPDLNDRLSKMEQQFQDLQNTVSELQLKLQVSPQVIPTVNPQIIPTVNPAPSAPEQPISHPDIYIVGDSHVRNLKVTFQRHLPDSFYLEHHFIPGAKVKKIASKCKTKINSCKHLIVIAGTNDVQITPLKEMRDSFKHIFDGFSSSECIHFVLIPERFDDTSLNYHIKKVNDNLYDFAKQFSNVKIYDPKSIVNNWDYFDFIHLDTSGKTKLCKEILRNILQESNPVIVVNPTSNNSTFSHNTQPTSFNKERKTNSARQFTNSRVSHSSLTVHRKNIPPHHHPLPKSKPKGSSHVQNNRGSTLQSLTPRTSYSNITHNTPSTHSMHYDTHYPYLPYHTDQEVNSRGGGQFTSNNFSNNEIDIRIPSHPTSAMHTYNNYNGDQTPQSSFYYTPNNFSALPTVPQSSNLNYDHNNSNYSSFSTFH